MAALTFTVCCFPFFWKHSSILLLCAGSAAVSQVVLCRFTTPSWESSRGAASELQLDHGWLIQEKHGSPTHIHQLVQISSNTIGDSLKPAFLFDVSETWRRHLLSGAQSRCVSGSRTLGLVSTASWLASGSPVVRLCCQPPHKTLRRYTHVFLQTINWWWWINLASNLSRISQVYLSVPCRCLSLWCFVMPVFAPFTLQHLLTSHPQPFCLIRIIR